LISEIFLFIAMYVYQGLVPLERSDWSTTLPPLLSGAEIKNVWSFTSLALLERREKYRFTSWTYEQKVKFMPVTGCGGL
jgi:hypothetical protein